jgi:hypothetical protein
MSLRALQVNQFKQTNKQKKFKKRTFWSLTRTIQELEALGMAGSRDLNGVLLEYGLPFSSPPGGETWSQWCQASVTLAR